MVGHGPSFKELISLSRDTYKLVLREMSECSQNSKQSGVIWSKRRVRTVAAIRDHKSIVFEVI